MSAGMSHVFPIADPEPALHTDPLFPKRRPLPRVVGRGLVSGMSMLLAGIAAWVALPVLIVRAVFAGFVPCLTGNCPPLVITPEMALFEHLIWVDLAVFPLISVLAIVAVIVNNWRRSAIAALVLTGLPAMYSIPVLVLLAAQ